MEVDFALLLKRLLLSIERFQLYGPPDADQVSKGGGEVSARSVLI